MLYPLNLELRDKLCLVAGGGKVAERKVLALLQAEANVLVVAPQLTLKLSELVSKQKIHWQSSCYEQGMLSRIQPLLVFCATDNALLNEQIAQEAKQVHALVNVATSREQSDFTVPSSFRRGNLLWTISTNGDSPALSRALREQLEAQYPAVMGDFLEQMTKLRAEVKKNGTSDSHQKFWRQALSPHVMDLVRAGRLAEAKEEVRHAFINLRSES